MGPELRNIRVHEDARGSLGVFENGDLPFAIRRVYYLFNAPLGVIRAEHGHRMLEQFVVCMAGRCEMTVHDGTRAHPFDLASPAVGVYVPPAMWRTVKFVEPGSVCCVFASMPYDRSDYIENFEDFLTFIADRAARTG